MRPIHRAAVLAVLTFVVSNPATSQTSSHSLTADDAVREALAANRDLQAAALSIEVAKGGLLQAGRLANPALDLSFADDFAFGGEGERSGSVSFSQSFPITARLAREKDVAGRDVAIAEAEVRDFIRNLVADVQSAFYSVRSMNEQLEVTRELVASIRAVENATARRVEAAEASPAEVGLLRIERLRLEQDAQRFIRQRGVAGATLARLLGREGLDGMTPVGDLDPGPLATLPAGSLDVRPDLQAAGRAIERADADRALSRAEIWEDWTVGLGYERERQVFDSPIDIKQDSFLALGISVPLPLWNRQQGRIAAAEAELRRSRRSREALVLRIGEELRSAEVRFATLRSSVDAYAEEILPEATRTQSLFERGFRQGLVGIAELLQAQRQYNESKAFYFELLGDLRQAAIDLESARGASPHLRNLPSSGGSTP